MICAACRATGRQNKEWNGFDADILHTMCDNYELHPGSSDTWCDCQHVTVPFEEPDDCRNCDGRKCMSCVLRFVHEACVDDCPDCCQEPLAGWETALLEDRSP